MGPTGQNQESNPPDIDLGSVIIFKYIRRVSLVLKERCSLSWSHTRVFPVNEEPSGTVLYLAKDVIPPNVTMVKGFGSLMGHLEKVDMSIHCSLHGDENHLERL